MMTEATIRLEQYLAELTAKNIRKAKSENNHRAALDLWVATPVKYKSLVAKALG